MNSSKDEYWRKIQKLTRQHLKEIGVSPSSANQIKWGEKVWGRLKQKLQQDNPPAFEKAAWQALYETSQSLGYQVIVKENVARHALVAKEAIAKQFLRQVADNDEHLIQEAQLVLDQAVDKLQEQMAPKGELVVHSDNLKGYLWRIAIRKWGEVYEKFQYFTDLQESVAQVPESFRQNSDPTPELNYQQAVKQLLQIMAPLLTARHCRIFVYMLHNPDYTRDEILQQFNISDDNWRQIKHRIIGKIKHQFGQDNTRSRVLTALFGYRPPT